MGKLISGAILIFAAASVFVSRYIGTAIVASGQGGGRDNFNEIMTQYSFTNTLFTLSIILAIIGLLFIVWGVLKKEA